jgi:uncharacterized membrane-anchored protein
MRAVVVIVTMVLIFLWANMTIFKKEGILHKGRVVMLEITSDDPRSMIQGDYMRMRYTVERQAEKYLEASSDQSKHISSEGYLVVGLSADNKARFVRFYNEGTLEDNEVLLPYVREVRYNNIVNIAIYPNSFFFQEGLSKVYEKAKYVRMRSDGQGAFMIESLTDEFGNTIDPKARVVGEESVDIVAE